MDEINSHLMYSTIKGKRMISKRKQWIYISILLLCFLLIFTLCSLIAGFVTAIKIFVIYFLSLAFLLSGTFLYIKKFIGKGDRGVIQFAFLAGGVSSLLLILGMFLDKRASSYSLQEKILIPILIGFIISMFLLFFTYGYSFIVRGVKRYKK